MVEQQAFNLLAVGSSPTVPILDLCFINICVLKLIKK